MFDTVEQLLNKQSYKINTIAIENGSPVKINYSYFVNYYYANYQKSFNFA